MCGRVWRSGSGPDSFSMAQASRETMEPTLNIDGGRSICRSVITDTKTSIQMLRPYAFHRLATYAWKPWSQRGASEVFGQDETAFSFRQASRFCLLKLLL